MTNAEKYKTTEERAAAFNRYCLSTKCERCKVHSKCENEIFTSVLYWLDLEAKCEKPLPCPFCGNINNLRRETNGAGFWLVRCYNCGYRSSSFNDEESAIAAHNRVARSVAKAKESEARNG